MLIALEANSLLLVLQLRGVVFFERESLLEGAEVQAGTLKQGVLLFAEPAFENSELVEFVSACIEGLSIDLVVFLGLSNTVFKGFFFHRIDCGIGKRLDIVIDVLILKQIRTNELGFLVNAI